MKYTCIINVCNFCLKRFQTEKHGWAKYKMLWRTAAVMMVRNGALVTVSISDLMTVPNINVCQNLSIQYDILSLMETGHSTHKCIQAIHIHWYVSEKFRKFRSTPLQSSFSSTHEFTSLCAL